AAAPKDKTHESANGWILFYAGAIIDPDQRKILHVVKDFEERDTGKNIRHTVIAIPPESDAGPEQGQLHRIRPFSNHPHPDEIGEEQNRGAYRSPQQSLLR